MKDLKETEFDLNNENPNSHNLLIEKDDKCKVKTKNDSSFEEKNFTYGWVIFQIIASAIPATFGLLFVFVTETINIIFIGQKNNPNYIAAIGIGTLYVNATGYIPAAGLLGGIDTLCSQQFGRQRLDKVGIFASIGRVSVTLYFFLITIPLNFLAYPALLAIGMDQEIVSLATEFCHWMSISVMFALQFNSTLRYLQAMNVFMPSSTITLITSTFHPLWCYILIEKMDYGIPGAAIAMGITQGLNLIIVMIYAVYFNPYPDSWMLFTVDSINPKNVINYLKKALPAALMFAADYIGFEILTFMSSFLGSVPMAGNICLFNYITVIFMLQIGMSMAASTLVGNSVGAKNKQLAIAYARCSVLVGVSIMIVTTTLTIIYRESIPGLYTNEPQVQKVFYDLLGIYVLFSIPDSYEVIVHGIIKGLGKQNIASICCLVILYPFNITFGYTLAFVFELGVNGLWYSQLASVILLTISYAYIYTHVDLDEVIHEIELVNVSKSVNKKESPLNDDDEL